MNTTVLGLVGSPNREGLTYRLISAALEGAARAGTGTELVQIAEHRPAACEDCLPWVCSSRGKCSFEDAAFEFLSEKILSCGALVIGTPVYWSDTSAMVSRLFVKMLRVFAEAAPLAGRPALGIGVAGGTGNGLVTGLRPVYEFFQIMQLRALEPLPATRFNLEAALSRAAELGSELGKQAGRSEPFSGREERLAWYDGLPFLSLDRRGERRLLAGYAVRALPDAENLARELADADRLREAGEARRADEEVTRVYEAAVKLFEARRS